VYQVGNYYIGTRYFVSRTPILALQPTQPPVQWVHGLFPECKLAGTWSWPFISI